jgi:hypothetical protein
MACGVPFCAGFKTAPWASLMCWSQRRTTLRHTVYAPLTRNLPAAVLQDDTFNDDGDTTFGRTVFKLTATLTPKTVRQKAKLHNLKATTT